MKKIILIIVLIFTLAVFSVNATDTIKTLTFAWEHEAGDVPVINWQMEWGVTAGGPYAKLGDIAYADAINGTYESPIQAVVTGQPGTHETRYFILRACGNVPQEDESIKYECSDPSNEVSHAFWITVTGFSAPVQFRIQEQ